ncbi:MAG: hypothetical protein CSA11_01560 [Chloroflexi bacterium]|nr:MAG: hypothetical protein CSA11_01560 [Chloroflexota bacterium]
MVLKQQNQQFNLQLIYSLAWLHNKRHPLLLSRQKEQNRSSLSLIDVFPDVGGLLPVTRLVAVVRGQFLVADNWWRSAMWQASLIHGGNPL